MTIASDSLIFDENECVNCDNTKNFHYDYISKEIICLNCGLVVGTIVWRHNHFEKNES